MPANHRQPAAQQASQQNNSLSPSSKGMSKYTNKDGSKVITIPKANPTTPSAQPSPTMSTPYKGAAANQVPALSGNEPAQPVNRKKAKRRAKAAAKAAAAEQNVSANGLSSPVASTPQDAKAMPAPDYSDDEVDTQDAYREDAGYSDGNGLSAPSVSKNKKKKKKKKSTTASAVIEDLSPLTESVPPPALTADPLTHGGAGISKEKIWNTSTAEERERIKEFWLGLGEDERKSLVKVEKDAVLKKMKEQQKQTCSCTVCGRKRTAIEEELEGLYDAYYQELEQYANNGKQGDGPPMMGPPRHFGPTSGLPPPRGHYHPSHPQPSRGRIVEHVGHEEDEEDEEEEEDEIEEEYSDEELEEDEYSDEEPEGIHAEPVDIQSDYPTDFLSFGNSLTVQGGILTVADDLLKNDGKKFIEMMEQLAERRMARDEDTRDAFDRGYPHALNGSMVPGHHHTHQHPHTHSHQHPHPPPSEEYDEEEEEDEDEEDYDDSQEEEYDEEDEVMPDDQSQVSDEDAELSCQDTMTEEQRMEEGRRMFQIFAARMFEQRVLSAYREKVAKERQQKLIDELEEETRLDSQRKAKKAKDAQKRKDKQLQKKQQQAEKLAKKEAEKAAAEAERIALEQKKAEEARIKAEERRRKKEMQKRAEDDERLRKEAERQRRAHEQKERQAEVERKAREAREKEKRVKEEQRLKEKEARELREREVRERKDKMDRERRDNVRESKAARAERETKDKAKQDERTANKSSVQAAVPITLAKRPSQHNTALPHQNAANIASPQIPIATPVLSKAPTPMRPRQTSQQGGPSLMTSQPSFTGSQHSQDPSPKSATPVHASPGPIGAPKGGFGGQAAASSASYYSHPTSPLGPNAKPPSAGLHSTPFPPPLAMPSLPPGLLPPIHNAPPGFSPRLQNPPFPPHMGPSFGHIPMHHPSRGYAPGHPPPGFGHPPINEGMPFALPKETTPGSHSTHSRQASNSFETTPPPAQAPSTQPIARPAPIGRPSSVVQGQRPKDSSRLEADDDKSHLGSSALLDDSDVPLDDYASSSRRGTAAPGPRAGFGMAPFMEPFNPVMNHVWGPSVPGLGSPFPPIGHSSPHGLTGTPNPPPGFGPIATGWGQSASTPFASGAGASTRGQPRAVSIRVMLCQACKELQGMGVSGPDGYIDLAKVKAQCDLLNPFPQEQPIAQQELLDMCETEGNSNNGGGSFDMRTDPSSGKVSIRWQTSNIIGGGGVDQILRAVGAVGGPGEIGSPVVGAPPGLPSGSAIGSTSSR